MRVLRSGLLSDHGFRHGFSLRAGAEESLQILADELGYPPERLYQVSQVHADGVRVVGPDDDPAEVGRQEADALVAPAAHPAVAVAVRVADCIPLLLADPVTGAVAAVHAGWRGTVARVVDRAIDALEREAGVRPGDLLAAIGPHIRVDAFEVGEDVAARVAAEAHGEDVVRRGGERPHVDLARVVRAQLRARGLAEARIDDVGGCTMTEPDRFFSYRRDGKGAGRHLGVVLSRP